MYRFTTPVLNDGSHFLTARVQMIDPSTPTQTGFGDRSQSLEIVVDRTPPTVTLGGLTEDPGVIPQPGTFVDRKTNDSTPTFFGFAEANSIIRVFADRSPLNGVFDVPTSTGSADGALPYDGSNQFPNGQWVLTSNLDLNNPAFFPLDRLRQLFVTAEDLAQKLEPHPQGRARHWRYSWILKVRKLPAYS